MKYYVYNPLTRNQTGKEAIKKLNKNDIYDCTNKNEMKELEKLLQKDDIIYVIGGDGTIHYLINNYNFLFKHKILFYKNGSGNDFHRSLKDSNAYYYTINNKYSFINSFGLGFDALVCKKVNQEKNKTKLSYLKQCYLSLKEYQPINIDIHYHNKWHHYKNVWLCSLQNGKYFGGGINIARNADVANEKIDLCIGHNLSTLKVLILLLFVKLGLTHLFSNYFFTVKVSDLIIKNQDSLLCQFDGDTFTINNDLEITNCQKIKINKVNSLENND
ncbi:hypothetical protein LJB88_02020 [Erysipelotrichaceae bacterium OttesenSCG-928-M19]|nr:hypothetical protein [Erysipelotrichaceae bacterium OttesenSCG-928-M19]